MPDRRKVLVVTGSRSEFGLLRPVMDAVREHPALELLVVAAGSHLIQPAITLRDVKALFNVADSVPMQIAGKTGRYEDAEAVGRGVGRFARVFLTLQPHWIVVLGDRIEAFAAASAAAVGGWALAHIHGGDRAEGVADEAMRHAITKLANLHLPASEASAHRIRSMGEPEDRIHVIGSPAIDGLDRIPPISAADLEPFRLTQIPRAIFLMHPIGRPDADEELAAGLALRACIEFAGGPDRVLALDPNHDPGRDGIIQAIERSGVPRATHLPRELFVGLLNAAATSAPGAGLLVGNSSAGLIEAAAVGLPVVDIGLRQNGRERGTNVTHAPESAADIRAAIHTAAAQDRASFQHPFGDGHAGPRAAKILAQVDPTTEGFTRKHCTF
jgi:UDP-hydrolysing UDP-N-acetyl-D-glucosamine 2-epimerase